MRKILLFTHLVLMSFISQAQQMTAFHGTYGQNQNTQSIKTAAVALGNLSNVVVGDMKPSVVTGISNNLNRILVSFHQYSPSTTSVDFNAHTEYTYVSTAQNASNNYSSYVGDGYVVTDVKRIVVSSLEKFMICGYTSYTDLSTNSAISTVKQGFIMMIDNLGNPNWYKHYNSSSNPLLFNSMVPTSHGKMMACGTKETCTNNSAFVLMVEPTTGNFIASSGKEYVMTGYNSEYNQIIRIRDGITSAHPGAFALVGSTKVKSISSFGPISGDVLVTVLPYEHPTSTIVVAPLPVGAANVVGSVYSRTGTDIYYAEAGKNIAVFKNGSSTLLYVGGDAYQYSSSLTMPLNKSPFVYCFDLSTVNNVTGSPIWSSSYNVPGYASVEMADLQVQSFSTTLPITNQLVMLPIVNALFNMRNAAYEFQSGLSEIDGNSGLTNGSIVPGGYILSNHKFTRDTENNVKANAFVENQSRNWAVTSEYKNAANNKEEMFSVIKKNTSGTQIECDLMSMDVAPMSVSVTRTQVIHTNITASVIPIVMVRKTLSFDHHASLCAEDFEECVCIPAGIVKIQRQPDWDETFPVITNTNKCPGAQYCLVATNPSTGQSYTLDITDSVPDGGTVQFSIFMSSALWSPSAPPIPAVYRWKLLTKCPDGQTFAFDYSLIRSTTLDNDQQTMLPNLASLQEIEESQDLSQMLTLFPNPASEQLTLQYISIHEDPILDIDILDARGSVVSQVRNQERWCNCIQSIEIDLHDLSEGVYFIQIKDGEEMIRKRFVTVR